ncbi:MAG: hypothetical protein ABFC84_19005 [Veillonellales bacterium]
MGIKKQEIINSINDIQKTFSVPEFENHFVSIIKNYLNGTENKGYYDMRNQLDMEFNTDMCPVIMYIINSISISYPDVIIYKYIKVIDKIKEQYGNILHSEHENAINPFAQRTSLETVRLDKSNSSKVTKLTLSKC